MLPLALVGLVVAIALVDLVAGPSTSERDRATRALRDFSAAVAERRGADVCERATAPLATRIADRVPGYGGCAAVASNFGVGFDGRVVAAAEYTRVILQGNTARIAGLRGADDRPLRESFGLVRVDGDWKVDDTGVAPVTPLDRGR